MRLLALRALAAPAWLAGAALALLALPLLAGGARVLGRLTGSRAPVTVVRLLAVYVTGELRFVTDAARLRARRPAPAAWQDALFALLRRFVDDVVTTAFAGLHLRLELEADPDAFAALARDRPVLVFARHAGPGDSVMLVHLLLSRLRREPEIVLKRLLVADPVVGVVAETLPVAAIEGGGEAVDAVRRLAARLGPRGALLLFPEGGNFSPERRRRAIAWLDRHGEAARARRAEGRRNVLPPRPGGAAAAVAGAPDADVLLCAHTGLGRAARGLDLLRGIPEDGPVRVRLWHVPAGEAPPDEVGQAAWLDDWWDRLDAWVEAQGLE